MSRITAPDITCSVEGCEEKYNSRGLCQRHYNRAYHQGSLNDEPYLRDDVEGRFWTRVEKTDTCWTYEGSHNGLGYKSIQVNKRRIYAHRFAYELVVGPVPDGLQLDHLCRNPSCVNPDHLEPVTNRENSLRGVSPFAYHARKTHCPKGHPYDDENTWRDKYGGRHCRSCMRERNRAYYHANRDRLRELARRYYWQRKRAAS